MLDAIWGQREGFPLKPDPTLAQELIRELEARPVAYVGDSQVDISLGKNLGLPTVLMTWGSRTPAELLAADPSAILADTAAQLEALFAMTPYYWKTPRDGAARLAALPQLTTTIAFRFLVFEKL